MTDSELMCLTLAQSLLGFASETHGLWSALGQVEGVIRRLAKFE
nr:hypothetical protein [Streptomyces antibioticus]